MDIANQIMDFLSRKFDVEQDDDFSFDVNLFDYGYVDSLDATEIILFLEQTFSVEITQADLIKYPMNTVNELAAVVSAKIGQA